MLDYLIRAIVVEKVQVNFCHILEYFHQSDGVKVV